MTPDFEPHAMRVGYNKVFGGLMLALAVLCLAMGLFVHAPMSIAVGALNTVVGILYLSRPYFVLTSDAIELKNLLGMTMRRHGFAAISQLEVEPDLKTIWLVQPGGERTRLRLSRWLADPADWRRFVLALQARAFE